MKKLTNQEIFDTVAAHLLKQKQRSMWNEEECAYRGANGLKCAIGCLIPDEFYDIDMERRDVINLLVDFNLGFEVNPSGKRLLWSLQECHDIVNPDDWNTALRSIADHFNLRVNF